LIDLWSSLNVPLYITPAFPSSSEPDPQAHPELDVAAPCWRQPWSEASQADWIDLHLPLFLAKQSVVGIFWSHYRDGEPHYFPHAGLLHPDGTPKPALSRIAAHRHAHSQVDVDATDATEE
jgi:hypothetical protein